MWRIVGVFLLGAFVGFVCSPVAWALVGWELKQMAGERTHGHWFKPTRGQ